MPQNSQPPRRAPQQRQNQGNRKKSFWAANQTLIYIILFGVLCLAIGFMAIVLVLRAKGAQNTPVPTPEPTQTIEVTMTPEPTYTPEPTSTPEPTLEPLPTDEGPTAAPTKTPSNATKKPSTPNPATAIPTAIPATAIPATAIPTATPQATEGTPSAASVSGNFMKDNSGVDIIRFDVSMSGKSTVYVVMTQTATAPTQDSIISKYDGKYQNITGSFGGSIYADPAKAPYYLWVMTESGGTYSSVSGSGAIGSSAAATGTPAPTATATAAAGATVTVMASKSGSDIAISVRSSVVGKVYAALSVDGSATLSASAIKSGSSGTSVSSANGTVSISIPIITPNSGTMYVWVVGEDSDGNLGTPEKTSVSVN